MKLCFISYARNNNLDGRLTRFVDKLKKQLPQHLPHGVGVDDLTFFDVRNIENGDQWMERLADATRMCRLCVCFYSPPYFTSEYCGREVQVFLQRLRVWQQQVSNAGKQARAIVPVVWVPAKPPNVLSAFQYSDGNWPALYLKEGLLALAMRKSRCDAYNAVLNQLAMRIAAALAEVQLPEGPPIASFRHIESAFHQHATPTRYGIAALTLVEPAHVGKPFAASDSSLAALVERVAAACSAPARTLALEHDLESNITTAIGARELPLLVTDGASLQSPLNAPLLGKIAAAFDTTCTALVLSDPTPNAAAVTAALRASWKTHGSMLEAKLGAIGCLIATDAVALEAELAKRLLHLRQELIRADPAARVRDSALATRAASQGIAVGTQPVLGGPGA